MSKSPGRLHSRRARATIPSLSGANASGTVPGHPSFPSGHATQAMLMALCVGEAVKNQVSNDVPVWPPLLQTLARRIARNREIAGLHFRSDTKAGFELARKTFDKLSCGHEFRQLLSDAMCEWPSLQHSSAAS